MKKESDPEAQLHDSEGTVPQQSSLFLTLLSLDDPFCPFDSLRTLLKRLIDKNLQVMMLKIDLADFDGNRPISLSLRSSTMNRTEIRKGIVTRLRTAEKERDALSEHYRATKRIVLRLESLRGASRIVICSIALTILWLALVFSRPTGIVDYALASAAVVMAVLIVILSRTRSKTNEFVRCARYEPPKLDFHA